MAGAAQGDCPTLTRVASFGSPGPLSDRSVRRHPVHCAVARDDGDPVNVQDAFEIERNVTAFARSANGGLIVPGSALATTIAI